MSKYNYEQQLTQIGLNKEQALVYESLLATGLSPVRILAQNSGLKRSFAYKILDQLIALGLAEKREISGKVTLYFPTHPSKLKELIKKKNEEIQSAETSLNNVINKMISDFNLLSGKPNVQFFEGLEGIKKVIDDSLSSETEICSYIDNEAVNKYIPDLNQEYIKKRDQFKIIKKMISVDSTYIRERVKSFNKEITEVRVVRKDFSFATVMQIYDNKISYLTLGENKTIGVIIESPEIYKMHKTLFEYTWETAEKIM